MAKDKKSEDKEKKGEKSGEGEDGDIFFIDKNGRKGVRKEEEEDESETAEDRERREKRERKKAEKVMRKEKKAAALAAEEEEENGAGNVEEGEGEREREKEEAEEEEEEEVKLKKDTKKKERKEGSDDEGEGEDGEGKKKKNTGTKRGSEAGRLDEATLPYVMEVTALAKADEFEEAEDRSLFVENVWRELKMGKQEQLVRLITHRHGSSAVESLLNLSTPAQLYRVCRTLKGCMARVIFNPYGSHVLEALFKYIPRLVNSSMAELLRKEEGAEEEEEDGEEEDKAKGDLKSIEDLFQDTCDELVGGWFEIMIDARGSHVLRAIVRALSGLEPKMAPQVAKGGKGGKGGKIGKGGGGATSMRESDWLRKRVPKSFGDRMRNVVEEVCADENLEELSNMALNSAAGPLLQLILFAVRGDAKLSTAVCRAVLRWPKEAASPPPDWVNKLTVDESGSHMMEAVIEALSPADRFSVVSVCFKGKLVQLCRHGLANHVMQRMMDRATEEPEVKTLIQELGPHIAELLQWNRPGVVKALAEACARSGACQADFLKGVVGALKVSSPKDNNRVIPSILNLREAYANFEEQKGPKATVLGSMMLQAMVKFKEKNIQTLLGAFAGMSEGYVESLSTDSAASRAIEAFLASTTVPIKAKYRLVDRVAARAPAIGADKFGSHIVEACYTKSGIDRKKTLIGALAEGSNQLRASFFGSQVYKKCRVEQFANKSDEWEEGEKSNAKKRGMFEDLLASDNEDDAPKSAKADKKAREMPAEGRSERNEKKEKKEKKKGGGIEEAAEAVARKLGGGALEGGMSVLGYDRSTAAKGTGKKEKVSDMEKKKRQRRAEDEVLEKIMGGGDDDDEMDDLFGAGKKRGGKRAR